MQESKNYTDSLRPTTDSARETLFNVLANRIDFEGIKCLDLFAGTGAFGFESLSRGAIFTDFVEKSGKHINIIKKNAERLSCSDKISVHKDDVLHFLNSVNNSGFGLIFADPPYKFNHYEELLNSVFKINFSIFVLEYGFENEFLKDDRQFEKHFEIINKKTGITNFKVLVSNDN